MSVQNGERLATKQDLADMYQGILPYLGGMPEMVANKFSKGDLYSTDEKMIGQWIDGKPVYQKTIVGTISSPSMEFTPIGASVDKVVFIRGIAFVNGQASLLPFFNDAMNVKVALTVNTDSVSSDKNSVFCYATSNSPMVGQPYFATIQYTKTTDSPISIGNDTDYSTDEKIIGTWTDGSPVYQRTYNVTSPTNPNTDTVVISLPSTYSIKNMFGFILQDGGCFPINFAYDASGNYAHTYYREGIHMKVGGSYNDKPCSITIQYTKSST